MDDEPLSEWAERRDAKIGELRAVPITPGQGPKGAHLNPDAPRAIERWNGYTWEFHAMASNLAQAQRLLFPGGQEPPVTGPAPKLLGPCTGRHRKPSPGPH